MHPDYLADFDREHTEMRSGCASTKSLPRLPAPHLDRRGRHSRRTVLPMLAISTLTSPTYPGRPSGRSGRIRSVLHHQGPHTEPNGEASSSSCARASSRHAIEGPCILSIRQGKIDLPSVGHLSWGGGGGDFCAQGGECRERREATERRGSSKAVALKSNPAAT